MLREQTSDSPQINLGVVVVSFFECLRYVHVSWTYQFCIYVSLSSGERVSGKYVHVHVPSRFTLVRSMSVSISHDLWDLMQFLILTLPDLVNAGFPFFVHLCCVFIFSTFLCSHVLPPPGGGHHMSTATCAPHTAGTLHVFNNVA